LNRGKLGALAGLDSATKGLRQRLMSVITQGSLSVMSMSPYLRISAKFMIKHNKVLSKLLFACALIPALVYWMNPQDAIEWRFDVPEIVPSSAPPAMNVIFDLPYPESTAHAVALMQGEQQFSAIWFQGSREGATDIVIKKMDFALSEGKWAPIGDLPTDFLSSESVSRQFVPHQGVKTLGNTIQLRDGDFEQLLVTVVSIGGWAMSSIASLVVDDGLVVSAQKLNLSPFLNRSHLVRSATIQFSNGDIGIPAYLELGNAYGELVRLDGNNRVVAKSRMGQGRYGIQPLILPLTATHAISLMRNFDGKNQVYRSQSHDGGRTWTQPDPIADLPNPNAPVAGVTLSDGSMLIAFNDSATNADQLSLGVSRDGGDTWQRIYDLPVEENSPVGAMRYPAMSRMSNGDIILAFSYGGKKGVRIMQFNENWVKARQ